MASLNIDGRLYLSGCLVINDEKELLLLYRKDHKHYETPGGKVEDTDCRDPLHPTIDDFARTAKRELAEEVCGIVVDEQRYFGGVEFTIPDGRKAVAHKFLMTILSGTPQICETQTFASADWLPIARLEQYPLSPDLKLFLTQIKRL